MKREYGAEQPYIPFGIFKIRIPFIHYRFELPEAAQAILMCATCLGAIPVLEEYLGLPYEIAWSMVIINGLLYFLHATLGDPVVPGWVTPAIPLVLAYLGNYSLGPERIQAMVAVQLIVGLIFLILGITGIANKLMKAIPTSIQSGILLGAGFSAVMGEFSATGRFSLYPISIAISGLLAYFLLFSSSFASMRKKYKVVNAIGKFGMLPAIILGIIIGPLSSEIAMPNVEIGTFIFIPKIREVIEMVSPLSIGWPDAGIYMQAVPVAIMCYIIAFGDFVTAGALIGGANELRPDEIIDFNPSRSNLISAIRNLIMAVISPYTQLCGPLWAAVTASVSQRYKEGRSAMDSIFSGVGTFRMMTAISVAIIPVATLVRPVLPVALSITMLVQGYVCTTLAMQMCKTDTEKGIAGVMGAVLATKGAAWGLAVGIILHVLISFDALGKKMAEADSGNEEVKQEA